MGQMDGISELVNKEQLKRCRIKEGRRNDELRREKSNREREKQKQDIIKSMEWNKVNWETSKKMQKEEKRKKRWVKRKNK